VSLTVLLTLVFQASILKEFTSASGKRAWIIDPDPGFSMEWSPCGEAALNMNRQVRLNSNKQNAKGTITLTEGNRLLPWANIEWRNCDDDAAKPH
jgi:hypothetical protein